MNSTPTTANSPSAITYASAGVDTHAGDRAVELMKGAVARTHGPGVVGGVGGFAGLYDLSVLGTYRKPYLATSTDGVGTKVAIAQTMDIHHTIGYDLVGMVVDDIVVVGAKPLFMTDYIACGRLVPERIASIVTGIAAACQSAGTALVGGETAEHPGLLGLDEYDVAGAATGIVEADAMLGPHKVGSGDVLIAMASSGLHSNGYSLVRAVLGQTWGKKYSSQSASPVEAGAGQTGAARAGVGGGGTGSADGGVAGAAPGGVAGGTGVLTAELLGKHVDVLGRSLGEELLEPTRVYAAHCLELAANTAAQVHAFTHVTGGGLAANLARVLPAGLFATVDRGSWQVPPIFGLVRDLGRVPVSDLEGTLNMGVGMVAIVGAEGADAALAHCQRMGLPAWVLGTVASLDGEGQWAGGQHTGGGAGLSTTDLVAGTKGVQGGAVQMTGSYRM